jgi:truncated hemoglobin YjbI
MNLAWRGKVVLAGCVLIGLTSAAAAEGKPPPRGADKPASDQPNVQAKLLDVLKDIHNRGADMYNSGDVAGCYRMFEGALRVAAPVLSARPDVQQMIESGLTAAEREPSMAKRAFALHQLIEQVRKKIKAGAPPPSPGTTKPTSEQPRRKPEAATPKTLWERLGGLEKVGKIVDDFVDIARGDPDVDLARRRKFLLTADARNHFKTAMVEFISQNTGGPRRYTGKTMKAAHAGMGITNEQFDAAAKDLRKALRKNGIKQDDADAVLRIVDTTRKDVVEPKTKEGAKP